MLDKIVLLLCETGIDQKSRNFLPAEFLRLVDKEQEPTVLRSHTTKQLPYFLKDLSVSHSPSVSIVPCEPTENRNDFIRRVDNRNCERCVVCAGDAESFIKLTTRIVSAMDTILASSLEVVSAFFAMFEKLFCSLPEDVKLPVMKRFYEAWHDKYGNLPSLGKHLKNFDIDVTECVNGIGDHVEIQNNFSKFKKVRDKLSFYLLTNPLPTLHRLLIQTLDNKLVVPGVLNIFRHCSVLFEQVYRSEKVPPQVKSVLLSCIISIFEEEAHRWTSTEQQDRLVYLLSSLCRRKRSDAKEKTSEGESVIVVPYYAGKSTMFSLIGPLPMYQNRQVLNANELVKLFVLPNLMKRSHEILMLKLLHRLTRMTYKTPELVLLIVELLMEYEPKHPQAADICHSLLKTLGDKLSAEGVVFEQETADFVLFSLRRYSWWVRYAVCTWFSRTLSAPKQQLPTGLYKCLALDQQEQSEQIVVDFPFSPAECFFRSLFELALFDIDLAFDFLKRGVTVRPRDENLVEKIAMALVDTCERMPYRQRISSLAPLFSEILRAFDPSQEVRLIESLCESTFHGLRLIQHLLLLAAATKLAYLKNSNHASANSRPDASESHGHEGVRVADDLLQAFCELSKGHAEKEVINLRRSKLPFPPEIKEDLLPPAQVTIRRDERVYSQLSTLFNVACSITRLVSQPPFALQVLINCLTELLCEVQNMRIGPYLDDLPSDHHKPPFALQVLINCLTELLCEVQNMRIGPYLDDLPSDHHKSNTVYAVAQPAASKKQPHHAPEADSAFKKKATRTQNTVKITVENRTFCAENELFGTIGVPCELKFQAH
ncbi:hypothetical protein COOONC_01178 [Cooperia oncophora]